MTKILLVEDDKSLREIYGVRLLAEGYDIVSAGDGEEALAMAIKERPELIISDVMMPKISGFDMLDILRSTTETRDIRVIMMTALSSDDQRARGEQLGADRYLVKSQVGIEDVVRTVHEVLEDAARASGAPQAADAPAPTMSPAPSEAAAASSLPRPTAPFSSPKPDNLGERVINPLPNAPTQDVASQINQELAAASAPAPEPQFQAPEPVQQPAPEPVQQPTTSPEPQVATAPAPVQPQGDHATSDPVAATAPAPQEETFQQPEPQSAAPQPQQPVPQPEQGQVDPSSQQRTV